MAAAATMTIERNTRQRLAIRNAFERAGRPLGADEVLRAAQHDVPGIGIATVYRNIKVLTEMDWLTAGALPGEPPRYEPAGQPAHHHFRCRRCRRVFDVPGSVAGVADIVPRRFQLEDYQVLLEGRCADCSAGG